MAGHDDGGIEVMAEIRVPTLGESVTEATIGKWFKQPGDPVAVDEPLVELETDKVTIEVPAPAAGVLADIAAKDGQTVAVGALLGQIKEGAKEGTSAPAAKPAAAPTGRPDQKTTTPIDAAEEEPKLRVPPKADARPLPSPPPLAGEGRVGAAGDLPLAPSVRKLAAESGVDAATVPGSGKDGRITKGDMMAAIERAAAAPTPIAQPAAAIQVRASSLPDDASREERVKMTRLRQTIARRLKEAQNTAAMLTTFNEVDMSAVMHLRSQYKDLFEKKHGAKLGFMGFFVKACVQALKEIPAVNAEIDGTDLIYKNYYHIGIAVGTERGLVVPVVRDCDAKSLAQIEKEIADFGRRARDGALKIEEMQGGTFTITNGGVYGSLMSTPILNAPQSGILGMHKIQERPMVIAGKIEARPMMYLALSYDHRVVDGREAVTFLVRVKEVLEDPTRLVVDL
jgi:2-oxoglutarate dehydrogenase E2 component (dihydrolipoamide succinyltransferase)